MENKAILLMKRYIERASEISSVSELYALDSEFAAKFEDAGADEFEELLHSVSGLARKYVRLKEGKHGRPQDTAELSGAARKEYLQVQKLLDGNLLTYHFQPIVRADNGHIFAYEALMRADGMEGITPYHILKYAELSGRLSEVEEYTFLNILNMLTRDPAMLYERQVFINSMANVGVSEEKEAEIERLIADRKGSIVIEITESSEYSDSDLETFRTKYGAFGIPMAVDDFGTGYSNISNLLRYKPDYVKIDRSLISGIEDNANKRHFVREIIDFCHENNIKSLAEGVETSEELRTVILLGADLIQGFYTARPSAEVINEIPYALRAEIRASRQELEDGRRLRKYSAGKYEKVSLEQLAKKGYSCIHIGFGYSDGSVTVMGTNQFDSGIHILCADGFCGKIILENAHLSNIVGRPCIDLGSESSVTVMLNGNNKLSNGGIRVDESSRLITEGQGSLDIKLGDGDYYGIGNDLLSSHGKLDFCQDGTVSITAKSHNGICIGSGLGGEITIGRGRYLLNTAGASSIGIGTHDGNTNIEMLGCDFEFTSNGAYCIAVGSVSGNANVHIIYSSVKLVQHGQLAIGIGTITGKKADIHIENMGFSAEQRASELTVLGALYGETNVAVECTSMNFNAEGTRALVFGGQKGRTVVTLKDIDLHVFLFNRFDACTLAADDDIHIKGGRFRITLNDKQVDTLK